ncbi:hypothetical protein Pelo_16446 [Pelomyxa schiedti]|nr:hypothetical protein Pelo_16446 [Pelomyxa schiedti]
MPTYLGIRCLDSGVGQMLLPLVQPLDTCATVLTLKQLVEGQIGLPCCRQRLLFGGRFLSDGTPLSELWHEIVIDDDGMVLVCGSPTEPPTGFYLSCIYNSRWCERDFIGYIQFSQNYTLKDFRSAVMSKRGIKEFDTSVNGEVVNDPNLLLQSLCKGSDLLVISITSHVQATAHTKKFYFRLREGMLGLTSKRSGVTAGTSHSLG